jgi:formylmethanofuran dehydrogenase subunit E
MGEADCPVCEAAGFWICDLCGEIVYNPQRRVVDDDELCPECAQLLPDAG